MKTPFTKDILKKDGKYLLLRSDLHFHYRVFEQTSEVLARFKHNGPVTMAKFIKELISNWTVEDYLYELNINRKAPIQILREKNPTWYEYLKDAFLAKNT